MIASSLSFATILSLIPFLAVTLATIQYFNGLEQLYPKAEGLILSFLQGPAGSEGIALLQKSFKRVHAGKIGSWGLVGLLLTSALLISNIEAAINRVWNITLKRPLYKRIFYQWFGLILFPAGLAILVALMSIKMLVPIIPSMVFQFTFLLLGVFVIYRFIPHTKVKNSSAFISALLVSCVLALLVKFFGIFSRYLFFYGKLYGSIAAIPIFLIWILVIWYVVLFGAVFHSNLHFNRQNK